MCISGTSYAWLRETPLNNYHNSNFTPIIFGDYNDKGKLEFTYPSALGTCVCETHERPKVEYSYCEGTDIQSCADAKVADGWYPLGSISHQYGGGAGGYNRNSQAFWRWAE